MDYVTIEPRGVTSALSVDESHKVINEECCSWMNFHGYGRRVLFVDEGEWMLITRAGYGDESVCRELL